MKSNLLTLMGGAVMGSGLGFTGILTIVFIVLKLTELIAWSWFWVLSPLWISAAMVVFFLIILLIMATWKW